MPCRPQKARKLLQTGKARVVRRTPFTIQLKFGSGGAVQELVAGMDTGSKKIGVAVVNLGKHETIYAAEIEIRTDISRKMKRRAVYRKTRRSRKTRYRPARWRNRVSARRKGRLAPSVRSKLESHVREKRFVESILPVSRWIVETAQFDIHRIKNPEVQGTGYQQGPQQGFYNVKQYIFHRDGYRCQHCRGKSKDPRLQVHHVVWRSQGGTDAPENLITLCKTCHDQLHAGQWDLPKNQKHRSLTRHATHVGIVQARLKKSSWDFTETFGYLTKYKREWNFMLSKTHVNDAIAICCSMDEIAMPPNTVLYKRHVPAGDYRQTKGRRSETRIPTGKLFGLRKFDLIKTVRGLAFVKGKRTRGTFLFADVNMKNPFELSVRKPHRRVQARATTIIQTGCLNQGVV